MLSGGLSCELVAGAYAPCVGALLGGPRAGIVSKVSGWSACCKVNVNSGHDRFVWLTSWCPGRDTRSRTELKR